MGSASDYAIGWWKNRHEKGYFPHMEQHKDWKIYDDMRPWFIDNMKPEPTDVALEIGCGYGQWMIPLSRRVLSVDGVDIHQSLIDKAYEKFEEHGVKNASVKVNDGKTLPYDDCKFSMVYSISVFQHMPREIVRGYFDESARVLEPFGKVLFYFRAADGIGPYSDDIYENHTGDWSVGWSEKEILEEASRVGWQVSVVNLGDVLLLVKR